MKPQKLTRSFLGIVISIALVTTVAIVGTYEWIKFDNAKNHLLQKLQRVVASQSLILAGPVHEKNKKQIRLILASSISDPEVLRIVVQDHNGQIVDRYGPETTSQQALTRSTKINYISGQGYKHVGDLEIEFTDKIIIENFMDRLVSDSVLCLILIITFVAGAHFAHFHLIGKPLDRLMEAIQTIRTKRNHTPVQWSRNDEIGTLISKFNDLQNIQENFEQDLHDQVAARTQQLSDAKRLAEEANRAKSEFLATMTHELRTPLTSSLGSLGLLNTVLPSDTCNNAKDLIDIAIRNNKALLRLVNEILDFEKNSLGLMEMDVRRHDIGRLVAGAVENCHGFARMQSVTFIYDEPIIPLYAQVNEFRFEQALNNLLSNAAKFSDPGGTVNIAVANQMDRILISVKDDGPGIPEDFHTKIFEQFTQLDSSSTRKHGGTGLGLSISKAFIEAMNGTIFFETKVGVGSTFFIGLPATS